MAGDGKFDKMKGRAKEAVGDLTKDRDLQQEGKVDQGSGKLKDRIGTATDKVKGFFNRSA